MTETINPREMDIISRAGNPTAAEYAAFRNWLRRDCGTEILPEAVELALFSKAWEAGHSGGYDEVALTYSDLADLVDLAYRAGRGG